MRPLEIAATADNGSSTAHRSSMARGRHEPYWQSERNETHGERVGAGGREGLVPSSGIPSELRPNAWGLTDWGIHPEGEDPNGDAQSEPGPRAVLRSS